MFGDGDDIFLTFPVIIMRNGGLDGVALQAREYRHILNKMDIGVHVLTGRCETSFATLNPVGHKQTELPLLDFYHEDSRLLFANQFETGDEKEGVAEISDDEWLELFARHKAAIQEEIDKLLISIPYDTPVIVYNLVSLRHAQPAAAAAIRDLIEKYPNRAFLSHSADPDAERPEKIERIKPHVLPMISANPPDEPYSGGPYDYPNLYHIVLNPSQRESFLTKYDIPEDHIFEIPDFLEFPSREPVYMRYPRKIFIQFLSDRCLTRKGDSHEYIHRQITKDTTVFISPVRPVYRKRIQEAMLLAQQYGRKYEKDVIFVVTHPDSDDNQYFQETLEFADGIGLPYYHLGERFTLDSLDTVYENIAAMTSIGVVASSAGGWENALNEMARACIPFFMDNKLNSFKPLTEEIGIKTHGEDFGLLTHFLDEHSPEELREMDICEHPELADSVAWVHTMLDDQYARTKLIEHNYRKAYEYLSHDATQPRISSAIQAIYEKHGYPGAGMKSLDE